MTEAIKEERITDIMNLQDLKKYICPKNQHEKEWYMKCFECPGRKTCTVGKQAIFIMENETKPQVHETQNIALTVQQMKLRKTIVDIFSSPDPVREILTQYPKLKPQSIYAKVNVWKKNHPDLEKQYRMIEKVRFLWTRPYDQMTVPEIIEKLYGAEAVPKEPEKEETKVTYTAIAPNSRIISVKPEILEEAQKDVSEVMEDGDSVTLEDLLKEFNAQPVDSKPSVSPSDNSDLNHLNNLLETLRKNIADYRQKIQVAENQISAILTVQKLMQTGV